MGKIINKQNFRVEAYPRMPGNFGAIRIGGVTRSVAETEALCESIARDINRHVDGLESVYVAWDDYPECEHCGSRWTEDHDRHNGGCCAKDCDVFESEGESE